MDETYINCEHSQKTKLESSTKGRRVLLLLRIRFAHLVSGPRYSGFLGICPAINTEVFFATYDYLEKADLRKGCQSP